MSTSANLYCPDCGSEARTEDEFCRSCGHPIVTEATFCPECGIEVAPDSGYCGSCGASIVRIEPLLYRLSTRRVILMSFLSWGLYLVYWSYLTWQQYRDHTKSEAYPVWHALSLAVPIYGYFRMHAHVRSFKELMTSAGLTNTLAPGTAVFALVVQHH